MAASPMVATDTAAMVGVNASRVATARWLLSRSVPHSAA
jgi:hypothetical protein